MKPDLESIYYQLDLAPSCSLEEFQRAYRKRIRELHPDRAAGPRSAHSQAALRDLIGVYATVNRFHRRYGRMPGGGLAHARVVAPGAGAARALHQHLTSCDNDSSDKRRSWSTLTLVALFIALLILLASWTWLTSDNSRRTSSLQEFSDTPVATARPAIRNDVAHGNQQRVFFRRLANEPAADERAVFKIKWCTRFLGHQTRQLGRRILVSRQIMFEQAEATARFRSNALRRLAFDLDKRGAQRLMPRHQPVKCLT